MRSSGKSTINHALDCNQFEHGCTKYTFVLVGRFVGACGKINLHNRLQTKMKLACRNLIHRKMMDVLNVLLINLKSIGVSKGSA